MQTEQITWTAQAVTTAFQAILARANGGQAPARAQLHVTDQPESDDRPFDEADGCDKLLVRVMPEGQLDITVGIGLHWSTMWFPRFVAARSGSGEFLLLGRMAGRPSSVRVEDGRLLAENGWPFPRLGQAVEAMSALTDEIGRLVTEAR